MTDSLTDASQYIASIADPETDTPEPEPTTEDTTPSVKALDKIITDTPPVADVPYWFATDDGWGMNIPSLYGTAHVEATKPPRGLVPAKTVVPAFHFSDEKVPAFIFDQFIDLARKVYSEHQTEVTSYICRDPEGQYSLFIPTQYVSAGSVDHKVEPGEMGDRLPVGTIHSHCMMSAFHSGTDDHDMAGMPGLHATIGMVMNEKPDYAIAIAVGKARFDIEPADIIDESITVDANGYATAQPRWLTFIKPHERAPWDSGGVTVTYKRTAPKPSRLTSGLGRHAGFDSAQFGYHDAWDYYDIGNPYATNSNREPTETTIERSERYLADEATWLAQKGYRLQWTITHDPEGTRDWLEGRRDEASTPMPMFDKDEIE